MKKLFILSSIIVFLLSGCIVIEDEPLVTVNPTIFFQGHVINNQVYVTATVRANPAFINAGNIPTVFVYEGQLELYNEDTGELLDTTTLSGGGLASIVEASTNVEDDKLIEKIVIIASGSVSAYADKESDGDSSNDLFIHSAPFYESILMSEVIDIDNYPVVTLSPVVNFDWYFSNEDLYINSTISARPNPIVTGSIPILYDYDGLLQIKDELVGLIKSQSFTGGGEAITVSVRADTASFTGFVVEVSGTVTSYADIDDSGNLNLPVDLIVSYAEFDEFQIILLD